MNSDLIRRQDAIDAIYEHEFSNWCDKDEVSTILFDLPSAEKTGKWIRHPIYEGSDHYYYACSECDYRSWSKDNYCSVCGAKMEVQDD